MTDAGMIWSGGRVGLQPLGAMLDGLQLRLPDGRMVAPLHVAPWPNDPALPGILRRLRGEWPCVPFGADDPAPLPARWQVAAEDLPHGPPHGFGSNAVWQVRRDGDSLLADIAYPDDSPVARLTRRVTPCPQGVEMTLTVHPRRDCRVPLALHPVFRLPAELGMARLHPGAHGPVWTHPAQSPDICLLRPDATAGSLAALPGRDGPLDFSRLPLARATESRLLLTHAAGRFALDNLAEGYRVTLDWDVAAFPHLMLWVSNRGRRHAPWNGTHVALGVEPCCAAFDLGTATSAADNPLARAGAPTAVALSAGKAWTTRYRISVTGGNALPA